MDLSWIANQTLANPLLATWTRRFVRTKLTIGNIGRLVIGQEAMTMDMDIWIPADRHGFPSTPNRMFEWYPPDEFAKVPLLHLKNCNMDRVFLWVISGGYNILTRQSKAGFRFKTFRQMISSCLREKEGTVMGVFHQLLQMRGDLIDHSAKMPNRRLEKKK